LGFIGTGIRFHTYLGKAAMALGPCRMICDVDAVQAGRALQVAMDEHRDRGYPINTTVCEDYRHLLDQKNIHAVIIGTPDHWHTKIAIDAMRAGKDVYCEKPLTLTIREGQQLIQVMNETGRVVQVGTQQRTEFDQRFVRAVALIRNGRIGNPKKVTVAFGGSRACDPLPVVDVPKSLNWDLWQGQAPLADYCQGPIVDVQGWGAGHPLARTHHYFRWWYEYSGGKLTDWGAHHVDIAMWGLDKLHGEIGLVKIEPRMVEHPVPFKEGFPTVTDRFNAATRFHVRVTFADGVIMDIRDTADELGFDNGVMFEGDKSRFLVNRGKLVGAPVEELAANPLPEGALEKIRGGPQPQSHMHNFVDCIRTRETPISDVVSHHRMLSICHATNIALRLGRSLTYDPQAEKFVGDSQADSFIERPQRPGYEIDV
jgi:predicted dehydrogenase